MVYNLNERGQRAESLTIEQIAESVNFTLDKNTLWYEISNQKINRISLVGNQPLISDKNDYLKFYPNPANNTTNMEYMFSVQENARFVLLNSMGQYILNEQIPISLNSKNEKQLNTAELQNGLYFCGFQFNNGKSVLKKLVVSH